MLHYWLCGNYVDTFSYLSHLERQEFTPNYPEEIFTGINILSDSLTFYSCKAAFWKSFFRAFGPYNFIR